jgi:hypothetical protein
MLWGLSMKKLFSRLGVLALSLVLANCSNSGPAGHPGFGYGADYDASFSAEQEGPERNFPVPPTGPMQVGSPMGGPNVPPGAAQGNPMVAGGAGAGAGNPAAGAAAGSGNFRPLPQVNFDGFEN